MVFLMVFEALFCFQLQLQCTSKSVLKQAGGFNAFNFLFYLSFKVNAVTIIELREL